MDNKKYYIKRLVLFGSITTILFVLLGVRLYYLQVYKYPTFSELALKQRSKEVMLNPKRGNIFDRNLIPLTNTDITPTIILPKDLIKEDKDIYTQILNNTTLTYGEFYKLINSNEYLLQIPLAQEINIDHKASSIFQTDMIKRYNKRNLLSHVIGYINKAENSGEAGLEKVYDEFLRNNDKKSLIIEYDKSRAIVLDGTEYVNEINDPNSPAGVKITIDEKIQSIVESIIDEKKINGAVVVGEAQSGKLLSIASRPNFNQDEIQNYFYKNDMSLYNKAIQVGYPPGSIFKIVVLLAALEEDFDYINTKYYCPGYEDINNVRIKCTSVHGDIMLEDAFAKSCNSAFIQVGKKIGAPKLIELAKKLGLGEKNNIGLLEEISGNLPEGDDLLGPAIGNISIGQGKIEVTPLQITSLLMTIANNGIHKQLTLIEGITNKDGKILKEFNKDDDYRVISTTSANKAYDYLISVVKEGTGNSINLHEIGGAGGKTGSAEAILNKTPTIHGWFTGFFPEKNPKYVITVLIEEGYSGSKSAAPIFEEICKEINKIYPVY